MNSWLLILCFIVICSYSSNVSPPPYQVNMMSLCPEDQVHRFLDISNANIERSKNLEFIIELYDTPIEQKFRTRDGVVLHGNFSKLVLRNIGTKKSTTYIGGQMVVKSPPNHVFNLQKIPELQIQIKLKAVDPEDSNPIKFLMLSQLYAISKFPKTIETVLSKHFNWEMSFLETNQVIKILKGFPMLMYRGAPESYPCRKDLLVILKREYQLIGVEDLEYMKKMIASQSREFKSKKAFRRKSLYEVYPIKHQTKQTKNEQL